MQILFWASVGLILYSYALYPLGLGLAARLAGRRLNRSVTARSPGDWPFVTLIIAAYKEEGMILQRVANALQMDYPADRLEILIGCDGQEDLTGELVKTVNDSRVRLLQFPQRRGKPSVLNDCMSEARGEIVAFSDANTFWDRDALKRIVAHFDDPQVGGVCGQLYLTDPETGANVDGAYWKYENFLKRNEGKLGALLGFNGAIYCIRRELWEPIPPQSIVDDFLIGMRIYGKGRQLVFDEDAVAHEETAPTMGAEFHRRARIGAGGFQSLCWLWQMLSPAYGMVSVAFWSHKVLRWCCPLFMAIALLSNLVLASGSSWYFALLLGQLVFYAVAGLAHIVPGNGASVRLLKLTSMFVGMNAALAVGFWRWATRRQSGKWKRTARSTELQEVQTAR
ncbi:glycosyltransferase family 2 protein [Planctomicrobium sp. SH664]|uniref:glycosyltransferase family 2 protein n=1 Tax=Planctomicrobium sp. SH664 TaxID=3448125 RepID=UPI003F5B72E4